MVAGLGHARFLVLAVLNGSGAGEAAGGAGYAEILGLNAALAATYGARYLDVRQVLIEAGDPVEDVDDIAADIVPGSLRSDSVHLNDAGYAVVSAAVEAALANLTG